jgi:hypothetical protein
VTQPADRTTNETDETNETTTSERDRAGGSRTRTRSRRGRGRTSQQRTDASGGDDSSSDEPAAGEPASADRGSGGGEAGSGGDEGSGRKRRRRGRRGRGRGRGDSGGSSGSSSEAAADTATDDQSSKDEPATKQQRRSGGGGRGDSSAKDDGGSGSDSGSAASKQADRDTDDRDREVREAMAKGGTRAAAKRGGGQGRSGNRRQQRPGGVPEEVRRAILEGPPRTMLVTSLEDRTQIAVLEDRTVVEHYVTRTDDVTLVGNIYMARVQNVLPGMEAAFLDIGKGRNGVLYAGEVLYDELDLEEGAAERIENVLKPGQQVLVQVTKDPMGSKGPRLTMHLSLAGRFMVLAPNSDLFGISRKLTDKERDRLRKLVKAVKPDHHGVIVRTAAEGATEEQITADVERCWPSGTGRGAREGGQGALGRLRGAAPGRQGHP